MIGTVAKVAALLVVAYCFGWLTDGFLDDDPCGEFFVQELVDYDSRTPFFPPVTDCYEEGRYVGRGPADQFWAGFIWVLVAGVLAWLPGPRLLRFGAAIVAGFAGLVVIFA